MTCSRKRLPTRSGFKGALLPHPGVHDLLYAVPQALCRVVRGDEPIFDYFGIEMELNKALGRKVWLKSGGYINIDFTEALVAIDVNTGRYVGKRNFKRPS